MIANLPPLNWIIIYKLTTCFLIVSVFTFLVLMEFGMLPEIQSIGFYCGDPKISHKFTGDTVSVKALLSSTVLLPFVVVSHIQLLNTTDSLSV